MVDGVYELFVLTDFRGSERNFTIGQIPKIWGNFPKICMKINENLLRNLEKNAKFSESFNFQPDSGKEKGGI